VAEFNNPFEALFGIFGDMFEGLFGADTQAADGSTMEWDPLEAGHVRIRYADEPAPVVPGSLKQSLRNANTPRLKPVIDAAAAAGGNAALYGSVNPGGAAAAAATQAVKSSGTKPGKVAKSGTWTRTNAEWQALDPYQKAAAMALMEADKADPEHAKHALASMVNRSQQRKLDLGEHVSSRVYQPTFEPAQEARLTKLLQNPAHKQLTEWAKRYSEGHEDDPTGGATHFLAHPRVMLSLEAQNPRKYRSWRGWTGFNPATGEYRNQTFNDRSHAFLAPEGRYSVPRLYK
jgi:hypothetical protein